MEVLARAALMLLYCGGKPSFAFFLFGAGSLGGVEAAGKCASPFPFCLAYFCPTVETGSVSGSGSGSSSGPGSGSEGGSETGSQSRTGSGNGSGSSHTVSSCPRLEAVLESGSVFFVCVRGAVGELEGGGLSAAARGPHRQSCGWRVLPRKLRFQGRSGKFLLFSCGQPIPYSNSNYVLYTALLIS